MHVPAAARLMGGDCDVDLKRTVAPGPGPGPGALTRAATIRQLGEDVCGGHHAMVQQGLS